MLKLPKDLVADPRHDAVSSLLSANVGPLWERGAHAVATLPLTGALSAVLREALAAGLACQGLEGIADKLAAEQKGLDAASAKARESPPNARVSRVLFVANDGSTRFYRNCDALLSRYPQRLVACRLDVAGEELGSAVLGVPRLVRSVLVTDKKVVAKALLSLLPAD